MQERRKFTKRGGSLRPICNSDLTQFPDEEETRKHVEDCIQRAENAQQHTNTSDAADDSVKESPAFQNRMLVYKISPNTTDNAIKECLICFENMEPGEKVGRLECLCVFHYKCIKNWFHKKAQMTAAQKEMDMLLLKGTFALSMMPYFNDNSQFAFHYKV